MSSSLVKKINKLRYIIGAGELRKDSRLNDGVTELSRVRSEEQLFGGSRVACIRVSAPRLRVGMIQYDQRVHITAQS